jgi:antitoxin component YwqK of YwqJK toxin-antitoxin module
MRLWAILAVAALLLPSLTARAQAGGMPAVVATLCEPGWKVSQDKPTSDGGREVRCERTADSLDEEVRVFDSTGAVVRSERTSRDSEGRTIGRREFAYGELVAYLPSADDPQPRPPREGDLVRPCPEGALVAGDAPPSGWAQRCVRARPDGLLALDGLALEWWPRSSPPVLRRHAEYRQGALAGLVMSYDEEGQPFEEHHYANGRGLPRRAWREGAHGERRLVREWVETPEGSVAREWNALGTLVLETEFGPDGQIRGAREWYDTGALSKETHAAHGDNQAGYRAREWWPTGALKSETRRAWFGFGALTTWSYGPGGELLRRTKVGPSGKPEVENFVVYDDPAPDHALSRPSWFARLRARYLFRCPAGTQRVESSGPRYRTTACARGDAPIEHPMIGGCESGTKLRASAATGILHGPLRVVEEGGRMKVCTYEEGSLEGAVITWGGEFGAGSVEILSYAHGSPEGPTASWWPNGAPRRFGDRRDGGQDGIWADYDMNGRRLDEHSYVAGELSGESLYFAPDGSVKRRIPYAQGRLEGLEERWDELGRKVTEDPYRAGEREGTQRRWRYGAPLSEIAFAGGKASGPATEYYEGGAVHWRGQNEAGERTGSWEELHRDGSLAARGEYLRGRRVGHWQAFHRNGQLETEGNYVFCERPAETAQVLAPSGQRQEVPAGDGCRVGTWTYFARDGHQIGSLELAEDEAARLRLAEPAPRPDSPPEPVMVNLGGARTGRLVRDADGNTRIIEMERSSY